MNSKEINKIACEIALKCKWDGLDVMEIFLQTLTECNFHKERKELEPIINNLLPF